MYLVVFRNRKRPDIDRAAYEADAVRMEALARQQPGFLAFKSYTAQDGEVVALSENGRTRLRPAPGASSSSMPACRSLDGSSTTRTTRSSPAPRHACTVLADLSYSPPRT